MVSLDNPSKKHAGPIIYDKAAYLGACALIQKYGDKAPLQACSKAETHRNRGDKLQCLFWRRVEKAAEILMENDPKGYIH